jgi:hypothetical protein
MYMHLPGVAMSITMVFGGTSCEILAVSFIVARAP